VVLLAGVAGWYGYQRSTDGFGGPVLRAPAAAPATRSGQFVVAAFQTDAVTYLLNPQSGEYAQVPYPVLTVSPDLRYAVLRGDALPMVDTRTGATVRNLGSAESGDVDWSPDGRWLALTHKSGQFEDRFIDRVRLLDLVTGQARTADIGQLGGCPAYRSLGWLADSTSYGLAGCEGVPRQEPFALVGTGGAVTTRVPGWPSGASVYSRPFTQHDQVVLQANGRAGEHRLVVYDLRAGRAVDQFTAPSLPSADQPLPGRPAGVVPQGLLTAGQTLVADGSQLLAWDLRTGATTPLASLPQPPLGVMVAPAGGLSDAAAYRAFRASWPRGQTR
jgi:hypothetical protein